jgi:hypothetical protein
VQAFLTVEKWKQLRHIVIDDVATGATMDAPIGTDTLKLPLRLLQNRFSSETDRELPNLIGNGAQVSELHAQPAGV